MEHIQEDRHLLLVGRHGVRFDERPGRGAVEGGVVPLPKHLRVPLEEVHPFSEGGVGVEALLGLFEHLDDVRRQGLNGQNICRL